MVEAGGMVGGEILAYIGLRLSFRGLESKVTRVEHFM